MLDPDNKTMHSSSKDKTKDEGPEVLGASKKHVRIGEENFQSFELESRPSELTDVGADADKTLEGELKPVPPTSLVTRAYEFSEAFLGVEQGPPLPRPRKDTALDLFETYKEPLWLQALDPYSTNYWVLPIRFAVMLGALVCALIVTFSGELESSASHSTIVGVGLAAFASPAFARLALFFVERYVYKETYVNKKKGQYPMVEWMSFTFFADAAYNTIKNSIDPDKDIRTTERIRSAARVFDERNGAKLDKDGRFLFDFVADFGDGFNPTYSVANLMGKGHLEVEERDKKGNVKKVALERARCVIAGGDLCYPFSSYENIFYRFVRPWSWAFPKSFSTGEKLYMALGNHEYIMSRDVERYLLTRKRVGGWDTPQTGTYFAIRLPFGWTMLVIDLGPEPEDIDDYQRAYFDKVIAGLPKDEKLIFVYHVPDWIKCSALGFTSMKSLRDWRASLGKRVRLVLTGDLHYYKRMELLDEGEEDVIKPTIQSQLGTNQNCFETRKTQFFICGHGGAFGHVTHFPDTNVCELVGEGGRFVETKCDYPSVEQSKQMVWDKTPWMFYYTTNHKYARFLGAIYMVFFMAVNPETYSSAAPQQGEYPEASEMFADLFANMGASLFFYAALIFILVVHCIMVMANFEMNTFSKWFRAINLICWHTAAHVGWATVLRVAVDSALLRMSRNKDLALLDNLWGYCTLGNISVYLLGVYTGPILMLLYYIFAYNVAKWHFNELPGIFQSDKYNGFLRVAINQNGDLDLYSIASDSPPHVWHDVPMSQRTSENPGVLKSDELQYYLLEKITLKNVL